MNKAARIVGLCLIVCLAAMSARGAGFINGGFEDGTFNGWTLNGGLWYGGIGTYSFSGDQGLTLITSPGIDPILSNLDSGSTNLPTVYSGNNSVRVNGPVDLYHFSTISQTAVWTSDHIYFAWFAVLQDPSHSHEQEPHFLITLHDDTTGSNLYNSVIAADTAPSSFTTASYQGETVKYSGWRTVDLDVQAAGAVGHTLTLTCLGSDCAQGGHWGYVYLDGFGAVTPPSGECSVTNLLTQTSSLTGVNKKLAKLLTKDLNRLQKAIDHRNPFLTQLYAQRCEQRLRQMGLVYGADTTTIAAMINCLEQLGSIKI